VDAFREARSKSDGIRIMWSARTPAILIINSPFRGLGGLVAMSLPLNPLNPLKGTYKVFTSDVYNKKTDNENCCFKCTQIALFHALGKLPEPEQAHRFY